MEGFLQYVCVSAANASEGDEGEQMAFKCVNTDQFYHFEWVRHGRSGNITVDVLCDQDTNFYQACAARTVMKRTLNYPYSRYLYNRPVTSPKFPCGYFCRETVESDPVLINFDNSLACIAGHNCLNTGTDDAFCENKKNGQCDLICDPNPSDYPGIYNNIYSCEDESSCSGFNYGLWCDDHLRYVKPQYVCDDLVSCRDVSDESNCNIDNETVVTCKHKSSGITVPLFNYTRCGPILYLRGYSKVYPSYRLGSHYLCDDFIDQTNCSDHSRVGLHCPVRGYMSTVAHQMICNHRQSFSRIPPMCDDHLDKACVNASLSCLVHKHQLCDGQLDCKDKSDETQDVCRHMAERNCERRFVFGKSQQSVAIPMDWVQDGLADCKNGVDEIESWPTCGIGPTIRLKDSLNDSCSEVFLCYGTDVFIQFSRLCDKIYSCENEDQICEQSRYQPTILQKAFRGDRNEVRLSYCLKGLRDIGHLTNKTCIRNKFITHKEEIFGKNDSLDIQMPNSQEDCRHYYGEFYVFLSCFGKCKASLCPLDTARNIKFDSCSGQFNKRKAFTIDSQGNLTFLIKNPKSGLMGNDVFPCERSQKCLTYDKVCNLVDDCGDGSDEVLCDNHFQCETTKDYIHVSQKCDQVIHCADRSDECNEACGESIISGIGLEIMAFFIGILTICLNFNAIFRNVSSIRTCGSEAAFLTNCLVVLISFGDLIVGVYLTALVTFDMYYGAKHCKLQLEWITSTACSVLGITSTLGSQISLFSMTVFSAIRAFGIKNISTAQNKVTKKSILKAIITASSIVLACSLISSIPMLEVFEDFFVNGIKYDDSNTLFVGCPDKKKHMAILKEYFGKMQVNGVVLTWSQIRYLVGAMFSNDYGGIKQRTRSFYGNDHVCVFKYLVRMDDPQRNYTSVLLGINCFCFAVITVAYGTIAATSRKSITALTKGSVNNINSVARQTDARLRRVIHAIIISDFFCWMPFTVICFLHLISVMDATPWYPVFSILVLPINAVVNPILYDKSVTRSLDAAFVKCKSNCLTRFARIRGQPPQQHKNNNNSGGATALKQGKNNKNSIEATGLEQNKNNENSTPE